MIKKFLSAVTRSDYGSVDI